MVRIFIPIFVLGLLLLVISFGKTANQQSHSADRAEPDVITNSIGMKFVRIPAGEFMMGAEEDRGVTMDAFPYVDPALLPREWPRHKVRITKPFCMGQYEVTLGQFMMFRLDRGLSDRCRAGRQADDGIRQERRAYRIDSVSSVGAGVERRAGPSGGVRLVERCCRILRLVESKRG